MLCIATDLFLEEVELLLVLQQTRPVLLLELLLSEDQLDTARRVVDLALLGVDLGVQVKLDVVGGLLGV